MRITKNLDPAGDERLTISGRFQATSQTPAIDLVANGLRFRVDDQNGVPIFARVVPGRAPMSTSAPGWNVGRSGKKWTFKDFDGTHTNGVIRVVVWDKSAYAPGLFVFRISAKNADFQADPTQIPLRLLVLLGGATQGAAGQCATLSFHSAAAPTTGWRVYRGGNVLMCG